jgi:hypothetical protein
MATSVFARPSGNVSIHMIAYAVSKWMGSPVYRIDTVETPLRAFYCFVHLSQEMSAAASDILRTQQVHVPANDGWVTIGLNTSGGYNPASPDSISHIVYTADGIFCVNRADWQAYMWSEMEETWVPSDIALIATHIPDMPANTINDSIIKIFTTTINILTSFMPSTPEPTPVELPVVPEKKKKFKRYIKTNEEYELARQLFV